ncbi:MAG TPA: response regulator [Bacillota bacterium]|nr:response regulator [Bacillota bacterium]
MKIKVLLVEDDPMVVEISQEFIKEDPDYKVVGVANSGAEAVNLTTKLTPDLILLDNFLPDFNGSVVIEKIRALNKKVDFIMITAAKEAPIVQELLRSGVRDYLIKPYLKQRLLQALQNYKQFYLTLNQTQVSQSDLDRLGNNSGVEELIPKGFSPVTEEKILAFIKEKPGGVTAEDIAEFIGITVVSARRYLKLLQDKKIVDCDLLYGKQGRPTYIFRFIG